MKFCNKKRIILVLVCLSLCTHGLCAEDMTIAKEPEFPADNSNAFENKRLLSESDLQNRYQTFSQNAVTMNSMVTKGSPQNDNYLSINGNEFDIPVNNEILRQPIGTFRYIDPNGDLHIANFINDLTGFKILNDYKPYANLQKGINAKNIQSIDSINDNENNNKYESENHINYDEYEFTFLPEDYNKTNDNNNNTNNDLKYSDSTKEIDDTLFAKTGVNANERTPNSNPTIHSSQTLSNQMMASVPQLLPHYRPVNWREESDSGHAFNDRPMTHPSHHYRSQPPFSYYFNWN